MRCLARSVAWPENVANARARHRALLESLVPGTRLCDEFSHCDEGAGHR